MGMDKQCHWGKWWVGRLSAGGLGMGLSREAIGLRASWELRLAQLVTRSLTRLLHAC